ncbi:MAG: acyl-CoA desaturase [Ketobacter sp.]|nr:MAG: acyl-CoA desaturase [Ketobacter sp.]
MESINRLLWWADNDRKELPQDATGATGVDWLRVWPFVLMHLACGLVFWVGYSHTALVVAVSLYFLRMFAITAFYHRYFAHKTFNTSRTVQFVFAVIGTSATQRGPLWWAGHHRCHHRTSDTRRDPHSPRNGFWQSHCGWFLGLQNFKTPTHLIKDFSRYPELVWLDRFDVLVPIFLAILLWCTGQILAVNAPHLNTDGWQLLVWGFFISTTVLLHATVSINSLAHRIGKRRFNTNDDSRNNLWLALITLGEGWHNNHHFYPGSTRQGFYWWEVDISFYILKLMQWSGLVWNLKSVPEKKMKLIKEAVR